MLGFIDYLIQNGYKSYRYIYDKSSKKYNYIPDNNTSYYSSSIGGYLDIRLIKDNKEVIYGLNEANHPPVLIYPRLPNYFDKDVDKMFEKYSFQEIEKLLNLM